MAPLLGGRIFEISFIAMLNDYKTWAGSTAKTIGEAAEDRADVCKAQPTGMVLQKNDGQEDDDARLMTPSPRIAGGGDEAAGGTGGKAGSGDMDVTIETPAPVRNTSLAETGPFGPGAPDPGIHDPEIHEPEIHEPESMDRGAMNSDHL